MNIASLVKDTSSKLFFSYFMTLKVLFEQGPGDYMNIFYIAFFLTSAFYFRDFLVECHLNIKQISLFLAFQGNSELGVSRWDVAICYYYI